MKHCPVCRNQYDDVTLSFCLEDGTPLVVESKQSTIDTISFNVPVTSGKIVESEEWDFDAFDESGGGDDVQNRKSHVWQSQNLPAKERVTQAFAAPKGANIQIPQPKSFNKIWLAVVPVFLVLAGGAAFFFYQEENRRVENLNFTSSPKTEEKAQIVPDNSNMQTAAGPQTNDAEKVKSEITEFVNDWKKSAEARNLADFLGKYAARVKYFDKESATLADVRAEAQQIFTQFDEIEITLSNLKIASTEDGSRASAVFDKQWLYEDQNKIEEGKTHTKLELEKDGGKWKITGERNLKVYLTEK